MENPTVENMKNLAVELGYAWEDRNLTSDAKGELCQEQDKVKRITNANEFFYSLDTKTYEVFLSAFKFYAAGTDSQAIYARKLINV